MIDTISNYFSGASRKKLMLALAAVVALFLVVLPLFMVFYGTEEGVEDVAENTVEQSDGTENVRLVQIVNSPSNYVGEYVRLHVFIEELHSEQLVSVGDDETQNTLLVVARNETTETRAQQLEELYRSGERVVEVGGHLAEYSVERIEREYNVDITGQSDGELIERPVLIADFVTFTGTDVTFNFD